MFLSSGNRLDLGLDEVMLHVSLKIEVGELILTVQLEKLGQLGIRVDLTAVGLILKGVLLDIGIDLAGNLGTGHLGTNRLAKETSQLITDTGWLDETGWLTVAIVASLLRVQLLGRLDLTGDRLLQGLEIILDRGEKGTDLLKLGRKLGQTGNQGRLDRTGSCRRSKLVG